MNKAEWDNRSSRLRVPCRCPIIGYCVRNIMTSFADRNPGLDYADRDHAMLDAEVYGRFPNGIKRAEFDYYHKVEIVNEEENPVEFSSADNVYVSGACPDFMLHEARLTADNMQEPLALTHCTIETDSPESGIAVSGSIKTSHYTNCEEYLHRYPRMRRRVAQKIVRDVPRSVRFAVLRRDGFCCKYCGRKGGSDGVGLEADHLISLFDGGTNDPSNLIAACDDCNRGKGRLSVDKSEIV